MPKIDEGLAAILRRYDADPKTDVWDCHGTWVVYHRALERIAAKASIRFDPPTIIEASSASGIATVMVVGHMGEESAWSIGEASPKNNKNAYPWAMAEKRAKDRVILKLAGLSGYVYSEEEADDFKESQPKTKPAEKTGNPPGITAFRAQQREFIREIHSCEDYDQYVAFVNTPDSQAFLKRAQNEFPNDWAGDGGDIKGLKQEMTEFVAKLKQKEAA